jgi:hypothetical protein
MNGDAPKKQTSPQLKRVDGPPKPPTKVTLDLDELGGPPPEDHPLAEMATALTNAQQTWFELTVLNGGGRRLKRESLELSLDRNVVLLSRVVPKLDGKFLEMVTRTLRDIRDYRRRFPRTDASNLEQAEQAQRILDEIPEV